MSYFAIAEKIMCFLVSNYMSEIDMRTLESELGLSRYTLNRSFMRVYGVPPLKFLWIYRVWVASRILWINASAKVDEIAAASGFQTTPHFYRIFKKLTGTTPSILRTGGICELGFKRFLQKFVPPHWLSSGQLTFPQYPQDLCQQFEI